MRPTPRKVAVLLVATLLGACRTTPAPAPALPNLGEVGSELMQPAAGATRMALDPRQRFVFPNLIPPVGLPTYPDALLPLRLAPVTVCVDAVIGSDGLVADAQPRVEDCDDASLPQRAAFEAASLAAVRGWTYAPALICRAPEDFDGDDACLAEGVVETPTAVRLSYRFHFSQRDGVPRVERGE
ncbi:MULTISPECIES: hypothetical protein [Luteimonas]|uniref:hypothetical protein n=1 Tax=Luteimonas TaxID=83614 RepID=UPI000C7D32CD|nr:MULTISPECIES: hypothetical protein [Luteimonas]